MDTLDLPVLNVTDSLDAAFQRMKTSDARAIVVSVEPRVHRLFMNRELLDARRDGLERLAQLQRGGVELLAVTPAMSSWEQELDNAAALYGVVPAVGPLIRIVTRHEGLAAEIRFAQKVCMCSANPNHTADSPPAKEGGKCVYGDGHYECY